MAKKKRKKNRTQTAQRKRELEQLATTTQSERGEKPIVRKDSPIDRLYRAGTISAEQLWCAEQFAHLHQAAQFGPGVQAADYQRDRVQESTHAPSGHQQQAVEDMADYEAALEALAKEDRRQRRMLCLAPVLISVACMGTPLAEVDKRVERRKQWAAETVVEALKVLEKLWSAQIVARKQVLRQGVRSPRHWLAPA
jgi:hypothetical protein